MLGTPDLTQTEMNGLPVSDGLHPSLGNAALSRLLCFGPHIILRSGLDDHKLSINCAIRPDLS